MALATESPTERDSASPLSPDQDTGLFCLPLIARFYDLPADGAQVRHQFSDSGSPLSIMTCSGPPRIWG